MSGKSRLAVLLLALMLVASTGVTYASAQADGEYSVEAETMIDIPDQTVAVEGANYTVTSIGKVTAGERLNVSASGPDGATFAVLLYTSNHVIANSDNEATDGSVSFSTKNLQPGTYFLAVSNANSDTVSPQPVVVAGYETTLNAPSELTTGESGTVKVQLDDVSNLGSPENVELVIAQDDEVVDTVQMTTESTYEYSAEIGSSLDAGEYRMYAMVHNETSGNLLGDDNDVVGVTDAQTLTISDGETGDQSDSGDNVYSSYNGSNDAGTPTTTPNETAPNETTPNETTEMSEEPSATTSEMATDTDSQTEAPSEPSTDSTMPNFALYIVALALVAAALVARR